jgi:hypothetical protein
MVRNEETRKIYTGGDVMAKRRRGWTEQKIARYIKEGRGTGELSEYKPWLNVQDVSSEGNSPRSKGWKTERIHELLSNLERSYYYYLEWANNVIDIREQFPLNRIDTIEISSSLNIPHPIDSNTKTPIVMTTDFFITLLDNGEISYLARTIKPSDKFEDPRIIEKFDIEKAYWEKQGINFGFVTEAELDSVFAANIQYIHKNYYLDNEEDMWTCNLFLKFLIKSKNLDKYSKLITIIEQFEDQYNLEEGSGIFHFKHLIAKKRIAVDMHQKIIPGKLILFDIETKDEGDEKQHGHFIS